jgi:hypothetical protein
MKLLNPLLIVKKENRTNLDIIRWWETRRLLYNLFSLMGGIISITIMRLLVKLEPGEDLIEPLAIIGFGILSNVGYTFGWLTEIGLKKDNRYAPKMFKLGLYLTLFLIFLPAVIHIMFWIQSKF